MLKIKYRYNTLEDFLISKELSVDVELDDGWGARFPLKGREIEATILFADISSFSHKTLNLSSTETLHYVNRFFAWISAEALQDVPCIIDKYIGDEIMIVFSTEFGSDNHFLESLQVAKRISENDIWGFSPHIGLASGIVTVGYVGTPHMYNCSVFGQPVNVSARCASVAGDSCIAFPTENTTEKLFNKVFNKDENITNNDWELLPSEKIKLKNIGEFIISKINKKELITYIFETDENGSITDSIVAHEESTKILNYLKKVGKYKPYNEKLINR